MSTTRDEIARWITNGQNNGSTHMLVMHDWFDGSDYPVYVRPDQDVDEVEEEKRGDGDRVMEVYWIAPEADIERQLAAGVQFTYSADRSSIDLRQI